MAWQVKMALGCNLHQWALMALTAQNEDGELVEMTTKISMEQAYLTEAQCQFTQAHMTPSYPLLKLFGEVGVMSQAFSEVLCRSFLAPPGCDVHVCLVSTGSKINAGSFHYSGARARLIGIWLAACAGNNFILAIQDTCWPLHGCWNI